MSIEAMKMALEAMENSRVFVTTREKIKHPEGTEWYDERIHALRAAIEQAEKQELTCVCGAVWEGETMVCAPRQRVCSGCDKTNNSDSMWAVYCVDCWEKTEALEEVKMELRNDKQ